MVKCQTINDSTGDIHVGTEGGINKILSSVGHYIGQYGSGVVQCVGDIAFMRNGN